MTPEPAYDKERKNLVNLITDGELGYFFELIKNPSEDLHESAVLQRM